MANPLVEAMKIGEEKARREMEVATHDNPIFKSVPATGPRGDQPAGQQWKDLLKDESLLRTIDRLKAEDAYNDQWKDQVDWGPQDPEPGEPVFGTDEETGQGFFEFVKSLQISPNEVAQILLPGEKAGDPGLGSMSWDDVQKHMQQNPGSAQKLLKKWKQLKGQIDLPPLASLSPEAQKSLLIKGVQTYKEGGGDALRNLLKPSTQRDQFGHPTGSFRGLA